MLYPLSYEGARPISYRPAGCYECPGVPRGAKRCRRARWQRFLRWTEHTWIRNTFGPVCPAVTAGRPGA